MANRILFVDDDENVVRGLRLSLREQPYEIFSALSGEEGLELLNEEGPETFSVIVSDMRMPSMDGAEFLAKARRLCPDTSRILLTGHADVDSSISAVNEGRIFRFLTKPCAPDELCISIEAGLKQRELIQAERVLLEETLNGAIDALMQVVAVSKPLLFGRARRICSLARDFGLALNIPNLWELEIAAKFSQLGLVILPDDVVQAHYYGRKLSRVENQMVARGPTIVDRVLKNVPRLEGVREIVNRMGDQHTFSTDKENDPLGFAAAILQSATEIETLEAQGRTTVEAVATLLQSGKTHPVLLDILKNSYSEESSDEIREVNSERIGDYLGGSLAEDLYLPPDFLLAPRGTPISMEFVELVGSHIACLDRDIFPETLEVILPRGCRQ